MHEKQNIVGKITSVLKKEPDKATKDIVTKSRMEGITSVNLTTIKKDETVTHGLKTEHIPTLEKGLKINLNTENIEAVTTGKTADEETIVKSKLDISPPEIQPTDQRLENWKKIFHMDECRTL